MISQDKETLLNSLNESSIRTPVKYSASPHVVTLGRGRRLTLCRVVNKSNRNYGLNIEPRPLDSLSSALRILPTSTQLDLKLIIISQVIFHNFTKEKFTVLLFHCFKL